VKIDASESQATLQFNAKPAIDPLRIIELVQQRRDVKLAGQDKLKLELREGQKLSVRIDAVRALLKSLG
jgi:transcription-repair coupling factor (superfamily II helicase)